MKCCIRPVRAAGPNLGTQMIGDTLVVHNYGHGGSGWSLSWGSAEVAVGKALSVLPSEIAVVGCGIIGLTTAVVAQRAGLKVTIYTRDVIQRTRSFRAHGSFTPDSRVALSAPAGGLWRSVGTDDAPVVEGFPLDAGPAGRSGGVSGCLCPVRCAAGEKAP
jgi:glycine/D-amino acid oxidase-like deaminating enzyme